MANLIPKTPPAAWVAMARDVLLEEGVQGVKVDRLAQRLGVTKGGFYKHFAHRDALLAQLLALWEADNVFVPALPRALAADAARERLLALTERLIGAKPKSWSEPEVTDLIGEITNMVSGDMKRRTAELGYNGLLAPPLIMQGDNIVVESKDAPISADNIFRIPELNEELRVRVFAKLEP